MKINLPVNFATFMARLYTHKKSAQQATVERLFSIRTLQTVLKTIPEVVYSDFFF